MSLKQKADFLRKNYPSEWNKTKEEVVNHLSWHQPIVCMCGKPATEEHEDNCQDFQDCVTKKVVKRLRHIKPHKSTG